MDLLVKGTAHTRMKVIGVKTTVKTSASSDTGRLTKSEDEQFDLSAIFCQQVWRFILATWAGIEKGWNRIAMYLERLRTRALKSLEGFLMYAHYGRVGAIPTWRVYHLSDMCPAGTAWGHWEAHPCTRSVGSRRQQTIVARLFRAPFLVKATPIPFQCHNYAVITRSHAFLIDDIKRRVLLPVHKQLSSDRPIILSYPTACVFHNRRSKLCDGRAINHRRRIGCGCSELIV